MALRIKWVLALAVFVAGCVARGEDDEAFGFIPAGCVALPEGEAKLLHNAVRDFFRQEVGVPVSAVQIGAASQCQNFLVFPVEATTHDSPLELFWFVHVEASDTSKMTLTRPE